MLFGLIDMFQNYEGALCHGKPLDRSGHEAKAKSKLNSSNEKQ